MRWPQLVIAAWLMLGLAIAIVSLRKPIVVKTIESWPFRTQLLKRPSIVVAVTALALYIAFLAFGCWTLHAGGFW